MIFSAYMSWRVDQLAVSCFKSGNPEQQFACKRRRAFPRGDGGRERDGDESNRTDAEASKSRLLAGTYATGI